MPRPQEFTAKRAITMDLEADPRSPITQLKAIARVIQIAAITPGYADYGEEIWIGSRGSDVSPMSLHSPTYVALMADGRQLRGPEWGD